MLVKAKISAIPLFLSFKPVIENVLFRKLKTLLKYETLENCSHLNKLVSIVNSHSLYLFAASIDILSLSIRRVG